MLDDVAIGIRADLGRMNCGNISFFSSHSKFLFFIQFLGESIMLLWRLGSLNMKVPNTFMASICYLGAIQFNSFKSQCKYLKAL